MARERNFKFSIFTDGSGLVWERVQKNIAGSNFRASIIYALDSELRRVEPIVSMGNTLLSLSEVSPEHNLSEQSFYYSLSSLTYVVTHRVVSESGQVTKNTLNLYIPSDTNKGSLVCKDVSFVFPRQVRSVLSENYFDFVMSRLQRV